MLLREKSFMDDDAGYRHCLYAESLGEFGTPRRMSGSGGFILTRPIEGFACRDAMGCYPLFSCRNRQKLGSDLDALQDSLVSIALVTDPFDEYDEQSLRRWFPDVMLAFKKHYIVELNRHPEEYVCPHHKRNAAKALKRVHIERCTDPQRYTAEWYTLYRTLTSRHGITGIAAFSKHAFEMQLRVPGIVAFRAIHEGTTVGMVLWYLQGDNGYYHLGAYSDDGYAFSASFALFWSSLICFTEKGVRSLTLGAGAGLRPDTSDGLTRFKRGWATGRRQVYFCGRIFNRELYDCITAAKQCSTTDYFPAYRFGQLQEKNRIRSGV